MATRSLLLLTLLALCALRAPLAAQKDTYDAFLEALTQSVRVGDEKRLDKAVRENPIHTVAHYRGLVLTMVRDPAADNAKDRQALEAAWERVYEGRTLDYLSRWLQQADASTLKTYDKAQQALAQAYGELARLQRDKVADRKTWEALRDSLMRIAEAFDQIGDPLDAADAWGVIARVYSEIPERNLTDRKDGVFAIEQFLALRGRWQWTKDTYYLQNQNWLKAERERLAEEQAAADKRQGEGYDGPVKGVEAYLVPDADAKELSAALRFEVAAKPRTDMCAQGGPVPMLWPAVTVLNGGPAAFQWFKGADIFLVRPGNMDFGVTLVGTEADLSKNPFTEVEVGSKLKKPSEFALDREGRRPYAMWFFVGSAQEPYMGINQNLEPTRESAVVYYKSAASWVAEVAGEEITFYDDNSNGKLFEDDPYAYGLKDRNLGAGPDEEVAVPAYDGMKIGKGDAQPYSEWVKVGEHWYHVRGKDDGTGVGLRPVNPEYFSTGMLELDWGGAKGTEPAVLIVQGRGDFRGARFDLSGGKPVEVPVGDYELSFGRIESGKGARIMTANVFPGSFERVKVEAGKTTTIALGAPFHLDFQKAGTETEVEIDAVGIRIRGRAGELYTHVNGAAPAPHVLIARSDDGKGAREAGEFVPIRDPETLNLVSNGQRTLGSHVGFYPIPKGSRGETRLKLAVPPGHFVGLQEKKNKLFGKLDPIFK
jgi:hypothetical protein